jgi:hypothetical protein
MDKEEIFEMMFTNGLMMIQEGKENGDQEMMMVGHAISTSVAAAKGGDLDELAHVLAIFMKMIHQKHGVKSELTEDAEHEDLNPNSPLGNNFSPSNN